MNNSEYYDQFERREEPKVIRDSIEHIEDRIRYLKAEIWDHERVLSNKDQRPTDEEVILYTELQVELVALSNCHQTLKRIGQGIEKIVDGAKERARTKAFPLRAAMNS